MRHQVTKGRGLRNPGHLFHELSLSRDESAQENSPFLKLLD